MSGPCCPTCGHALVPDQTLRLDPAGIVVANGRFAALTRQEFSLLEHLHDNLARVRSKEQLLDALYWQDHEQPEIKIIDVFVCKLRRKLKPLGVTIQTAWGAGYRLLPSKPGEGSSS